LLLQLSYPRGGGHQPAALIGLSGRKYQLILTMVWMLSGKAPPPAKD
jgi:hypothetical protein